MAVSSAALLAVPLLFLTQSRGGYISFAVAVLVMLTLAVRRVRLALGLALAALAAVSFVVVAIASPVGARLAGPLFTSPEQFERLGSLSSLEWRVDLFLASR